MHVPVMRVMHTSVMRVRVRLLANASHWLIKGALTEAAESRVDRAVVVNAKVGFRCSDAER